MKTKFVSIAEIVIGACIFYRAEKEYAALSKQLGKELDEKRTVIGTLSKQLEAHQKEFNELKDELSKVVILLFEFMKPKQKL